MKQQVKVAQYTIRRVPPEADRILRRKAAQRKQSLNQVILDELSVAAVGRMQQADFSDLVGRWIPDPAFDEILASQRPIDWDKVEVRVAMDTNPGAGAADGAFEEVWIALSSVPGLDSA